jgi:hypothetical protein
MIMRQLRAPVTPNTTAESRGLINSSLADRVRIWDALSVVGQVGNLVANEMADWARTLSRSMISADGCLG